MRVKLCAKCPYMPRDLAGHYDRESVLHLCAECDGEQEASTNHYPRNAQRRRKCATVLNTLRTTQPSVAQSVMDGLASSDTTPGEPPSVQKLALTDSKPVERTTADFYLVSRPPNNGRDAFLDRHGDNPDGRNDLRTPLPYVLNPSDTVFCFAIGGAT
jgi:hypothetical protein